MSWLLSWIAATQVRGETAGSMTFLHPPCYGAAPACGLHSVLASLLDRCHEGGQCYSQACAVSAVLIAPVLWGCSCVWAAWCLGFPAGSLPRRWAVLQPGLCCICCPCCPCSMGLFLRVDCTESWLPGRIAASKVSSVSVRSKIPLCVCVILGLSFPRIYPVIPFYSVLHR